MREMMFLRCETGAARAARSWARRVLREAGAPAEEARRAALRLAAGLRAAAAHFSAEARVRGAGGGAPEGFVTIFEDRGRLMFELVAEGGQPVEALVRRPETARLWHEAERRVAGDGAARVAMPVWG